MQDLRDKLARLADSYFEIEKRKHAIESETAYLMTNSKYYENMRHSMNHLMNALSFYLKPDQPDMQQFEKQFDLAFHHLENLDVNGYEYLAGVFLDELTEKIETSNIFHSIGNAKLFRKHALRYFDLGRDTRTPDKNVAMAHFEKSIQECKKGMEEIKPISRIDKRNYQIFAWTLVIAVAALIVGLIALLK